jgi:hypothetical protein
MIFIEKKRAKLRLIEHPTTHTSPNNIKRYFVTLAFNLHAILLVIVFCGTMAHGDIVTVLKMKKLNIHSILIENNKIKWK